MSTFIHEISQGLTSQLTIPSSSSSLASYSQASEDSTDAKNCLRESFIDLQISRSHEDLSYSAGIVRDLQQRGIFVQSPDVEQEALEAAIIGKVVTGFYLTALEQFLDDARQADSELEWWQEIERSRLNSAYYLLQTLPTRIIRLSKTVIDALRKRRLPLRLSAFSPSSIRMLFPATNILQPSTLTVAIFPHLHHKSYPTSLLPTKSRLSRSSSAAEEAVQSTFAALVSFIGNIQQNFTSIFYLPIELTRHECRFKKEQLEKLRDERATRIGQLINMRNSVARVLIASSIQDSISVLQPLSSQLTVEVNGVDPVTHSLHTTQDVVRYLDVLASEYLPAQRHSYHSTITTLGLYRPPRLTRNWPKLVFLPPLLLYGARAAYSSRASLEQVAADAIDTLKHFWQDWLLAPLKEVVETVRAGDNEGVIITHESVKADLDSLERMTLSLAQDKLHYTPEQMTALSQQIRIGDLTPVMQIYEDDIRNPLKSAVGGTLLRTLLVQVQKAKVDINQAVSGIDKLLKSQELTFAFVGVAPAMTLTYVIAGYLRTLWSGNKGKSRYGGRHHRATAWTVLRRIERLLITNSPKVETSTIDPRTSGLLLLSTTQLRGYAEKHLPTNSRIREGFLQDVKDLEDPSFGRKEKLRIVDRMWNSWGEVLGWHRIDVL
ncbi:NCA2-domain-containing protein [Irpex rosettiformis]|uniref:NCA2-domain-containing protein n=1 Tax=Irpex rosettiformis TaxID=378272 RepID=A0ACB8U0E6_9APHY|nr:NCA2-domain-containing protein [Irpex rosettiformis]